MKFEVNTLQNILEMQYKNYQLSQENIELINQKYHDLKHQLNLLKSGADSEKAGEYLEQMEREIKIYETQNKTGNKVLDTILTSKSMHCQRHGIELKFMGEGQLLNFMEDMDISALFGNMLDNASEAVCKSRNPNRYVHFNVCISENNTFVIHMRNTCLPEDQIKKYPDHIWVLFCHYAVSAGFFSVEGHRVHHIVLDIVHQRQILWVMEKVVQIFRSVQMDGHHDIRIGISCCLAAVYFCVVQEGERQLQLCVDLAAAEINFGHIRVSCQLQKVVMYDHA